jgi:uncharacterized pyridoxamine 5'-phosphate oxidase family protein/ferredoxin-like protein FixX
MKNTLQEALAILKEVKSSVISTVHNNKPESRIIDLQIIDDEIYFMTLVAKPFYRQLAENNNIAITVINNNYTQVRLTGAAIEISADNLDKVFKHSPSLVALFPDENKYKTTTLFHLQNAKGEIFNISGDTAKLVRSRFVIGKKRVNEAGLFITEKCIACGKCLKVCPFSAIKEGKPYVIDSSLCDECGTCYQVCPVAAIELSTGM